LDIGQILRLCPNLKTLSFNGYVSAEAFLRTYREGETRLEEIDCRFDNLTAVCDKLSNKLTPDVVRAVRDVLVLLALVAHVDLEAYKHVLTAHCGLTMDLPEDVLDNECFRTARYMLQLHGTDPCRTLHDLFADLDALPSTKISVTAHRITSFRTVQQRWRSPSSCVQTTMPATTSTRS
jgi:hypothetical protein